MSESLQRLRNGSRLKAGMMGGGHCYSFVMVVLGTTIHMWTAPVVQER